MPHSPITLPRFQQFLSCSTRENKMDLFYANIKDSNISSAKPSLRKSDHNLVFLCSEYKPHVQGQPGRGRSREVKGVLQGCFEATDWIALCQPHGGNQCHG